MGSRIVLKKSTSFNFNIALMGVMTVLGIVEDITLVTKKAREMEDIEYELDSGENTVDAVLSSKVVSSSISFLDEEEVDLLSKAIIYCINKTELDGKLNNTVLFEALELIEKEVKIELSPEIYELSEKLAYGDGNINIPNSSYIVDLDDDILTATNMVGEVISKLNPNVDKNKLNSLMIYITESTEHTFDDDFDADESARAVRDGKVVTLKRRKKRMLSSQRNKISRSMKKARRTRRIKPSTVKKMIKSRMKRQAMGL